MAEYKAESRRVQAELDEKAELAQRTERDLDDVMREATEVARASEALGRNHVAPTNSRSRGQAR